MAQDMAIPMEVQEVSHIASLKCKIFLENIMAI